MQEQNQSSFWQTMGQKILENFSTSFFSNLRQRIENTIRRITQKAIGAFILLLGFIFVMISLALLISELLETNNGVGYGIVGLVTIFFGLIISKSGNK